MNAEPPWSETSAQDFARAVRSPAAEFDRLQRGVELVVELVDGCDHAGVTVLSKHDAVTAASTDEVVRQGDLWQYELNEGPCLDSVRNAGTVLSQNLRHEQRWTNWTRRVTTDLGVESMLSVLLYTDRDKLGALNMYGDHSEVWDHEQLTVAHALASHLAVAAADAREIEHRSRAMVNRTVIGQAEGILMERYGVDAERAFAFLRRTSQQSNRKLTDVAEELVTRRTLPSLDSANDSRST